MRAVTLSVSVGCTPRGVYDYISNPGNLTEWAKGFAISARQDGWDWIVETAGGPVKVKFMVENDFGILDHYVTSASGVKNLIPMRVVPNGIGSEIILTMFQQSERTDEEFSKDIELAKLDLKNLKTILEKSCAMAGT